MKLLMLFVPVILALKLHRLGRQYGDQVHAELVGNFDLDSYKLVVVDERLKLKVDADDAAVTLWNSRRVSASEVRWLFVRGVDLGVGNGNGNGSVSLFGELGRVFVDDDCVEAIEVRMLEFQRSFQLMIMCICGVVALVAAMVVLAVVL